MTKKVNGIFVIEEQTSQTCDLCGNLEETRPYGPNGEEVCFDCGMKDKDAAHAALIERMTGPNDTTVH